MSKEKRRPAEGDLYDVFIVGGHTIPVYYGYMDESDKKSEITLGDHILPVTPDFSKNPLYDKDGYPLVTDIQDTCEHYAPESPDEPEDWCRDCRFFPKNKPKIGICMCEKRKKLPDGKGENQ